MIEFLSTYSFLVGSIYLLLAWFVIFLFVSRRNRKEMFWTSVLGLFVAPLLEPIFVLHWWNPTFFIMFDIGYGPFGLADFIFGWATFGLASVSGELFTKQKEAPSSRTFLSAIGSVYVFGITTIALFLTPILVFDMSTVFSTFFSMIVLSGWILYKRPDLVRQSLRAGITMVIIALPFYHIPLYFRPSWIAEEWLAAKGSGIFITGIPLEELSWFFMAGVLIGVIWEYTRGIRILAKNT